MGGHPADPCLEPPERLALPGEQRVRVLQLLATGTNGGAQEHVYSLISRLDRSRYDVSVVSLSPGSAARKIERLGVPTTIIDEPDDATAVGAVAALANIDPAMEEAALNLGSTGLRRFRHRRATRSFRRIRMTTGSRRGRCW